MFALRKQLLRSARLRRPHESSANPLQLRGELPQRARPSVEHQNCGRVMSYHQLTRNVAPYCVARCTGVCSERRAAVCWRRIFRAGVGDSTPALFPCEYSQSSKQLGLYLTQQIKPATLKDERHRRALHRTAVIMYLLVQEFASVWAQKCSMLLLSDGSTYLSLLHFPVSSAYV